MQVGCAVTAHSPPYGATVATLNATGVPLLSSFAARLWVGVNSAMLAPPVSMPNSRREITSLKQSGPLQDQIDETDLSMSRTELVIQLIKVALGLLIGAYFVWWSLEVLQRLPQH